MNFLFSDNVHILYLSFNAKKPKITAKLSKRSRNKRHSPHIWWCPLWSPCLHWYRFFTLVTFCQTKHDIYSVRQSWSFPLSDKTGYTLDTHLYYITSSGGQASCEPVSSAPDIHSLSPICIRSLWIRLVKGPSTLVFILYQPSLNDTYNKVHVKLCITSWIKT
jgi:hypothetical protein